MARRCPSGRYGEVNPSTRTEERIAQVEKGLVPDPQLRSRPPSPASLPERMAFYHVPGVSVAVVSERELDWARGYGVREAGCPSPVTSETLFQAASISKPVTALAVMRLVQQRRLDLEEDVNAYLSSWSVPANEAWRSRITLAQLLSHTAGTTVHGFPGYRTDRSFPSLVQVLEGEPPANTPPVVVNAIPGAQFRYSGGGTSIVQQVLMDVLDLPFPQLMRELVLDPLGMVHSTYEQPLPTTRRGDAATGHREAGAPLLGGWHVYPEMAAAGLWTTPSDLARVLVEVLRARTAGGGELLSGESAALMFTPRSRGPVGLGFFVWEQDGAVSFGHGGSNEGFRCVLFGLPELGAGAVVMTNGDGGSALCDEIARGIGDAYGWPRAGDDPRGPLIPADAQGANDLGRLAGEYELETGLRVRLEVRERGLLLGAAGQEPFQLYPRSEVVYYAEAVNAELEFGAGSEDGFVLRQGGEELHARQVG